MSAGFCLHCGLRTEAEVKVHDYCMLAWGLEQERIAKIPKTSMEQQLDRIENELVPRLNRIEGLLMAIRDRYSL